MARELTFVGRDAELAQLREWATTGSHTRIVAIEAIGGMGKTRLLRELAAEIAGGPETDRTTCTFLDLASNRYRLPLTLETDILRGMGADDGEYRRARDRYIASQRDGTSSETVRSLLDVAEQTFGRLFADRTRGGRAVVLVDTVDSPASRSAVFRRFLERTVPRLRNVTVVLAGRDAFTALSEVDPAVECRSFPLQPLEAEASARFFDGLGLAADQLAALSLLSGGRPILLGLAAQWLEYDIPLPELDTGPSHEVVDDGGPRIAEIRDRFRGSLVKAVLQLSEPIDTHVLRMAHFPHRYTAAMVGHLGGEAPEVAARQLAELNGLFFVKQIPGYGYVLHDEMRDLINGYVWPFVDSVGLERADLDSRIIAWYDEQVAAAPADGSRAALWMLHAERAFYRLRGDRVGGFAALIAQIDTALESGNIDFAGLLIEQTRELIASLDSDSRTQAILLRARWFRLTGRRKAARALLRQIEESDDGAAGVRVEALCLLATLLYEDGEAPLARPVVRRARDIAGQIDSERLTLFAETVDGEVLHATGLVRESADLLSTCAPKLEERGETALAARAYDRLAWATSILGAHDEAVGHARKAVALRSALGSPLDVAVSMHTTAAVMRDGSQFESAIEHYERALARFVELGDFHWEAAVFMERGLCRLLQYEVAHYGRTGGPASGYLPILDLAHADLQRSVELCRTYNRQLLPKAVHELGHVFWERGDTTATIELWRESLGISRSAEDLRYILENEVGMCELDIEARDFPAALACRARIAGYYDRTKDSHALLWSRLLKLEAEAHFGLGNTEEAMARYAVSLPGLAVHGGWGRYLLEFELASLDRNIRSLPQAESARWANTLFTQWSSPERLSDHAAIPAERMTQLLDTVRWAER
ncbi:tetratricopeptide repeat protein [Actinacidiphila epipremni]|uniref:ATP-binding protein n=1 Tax=Actinacidiphila epipremni TaxID=2053013 RepID=A0ABX0ZQ57_9ACTN|nr:tetratricopeptide repeat protein [Actinacidiphila epipremni]NJP46040.1 ATP-binding protein [Actinacidiphila epipremni]